MKLLRSLILRPLRRDLPRTLLTVLAVALGVAVVVAIDLAGDAATGSFRSSMETLSGKTDLEILANGGIDEAWIGVLDALQVNATFSAAIEAQGFVEGIGSIPIYGVDLVPGARHWLARTGPSGGSPRAGISKDPVSYTHLDVYKRQIQQSALAGEPDGLERPQAVGIELRGFIQRVVTAAMGVAGSIGELLQLAEDGDIHLRSQGTLQLRHGSDLAPPQCLRQIISMEGFSSHNARSLPSESLFR